MRKRLLAYSGTALVLSMWALAIGTFAAVDRPGFHELSTSLQHPKPSAPPPAPTYVPLHADCSAIRECLATVLPARYDPLDKNTVVNRALTCLGGTIETAWEAAHGLGFEFGRESSTGKGVALSAFCDDVCPVYADVKVLFAETISELHCECLGGLSIFSPGWHHYVGCEPSAFRPPKNFASGKEFRVVAAPSRHRSGAFEIWVKDLIPRVRLNRLGISGTLRFEAIDGVPIRRRSELEGALERMPAELPGSVLLTWRSMDNDDFEKELHFISRGVVDDLAHLLKSVSFFGGVGGAGPRTDGEMVLGVNEQSVSFDPRQKDEATTRLNRVAAAIRRAARTTTRRSVVPRHSDDECAELDELPTSIYLSDGKHTRELKYVDWMVR